MANQETLTQWILAHQDALDLQVQECSWIREVFTDWHDLDVSISVEGQRFSGRGSAADEDTALAKAFCEAVERYVCYDYQISSQGVAGHFDIEEAQLNAQQEAIERQTLAGVLATGFHGHELPLDPTIKEKYQQRGFDLKLSLLGGHQQIQVVLCLAGHFVGLGAAADLEIAKQKALIECLRSVEACDGQPPIAPPDFTEIIKPGADVIRQGQIESLVIRNNMLQSCPLHFFRFS